MRQTRPVRISLNHSMLWMLVAVLSGALWPASSAVAQGTSGALPDPISTHELDGYADRLKLSDQQRQAAHMIHDQYKQEFRALRQGEIAEFLKEMRAMQGTMMMPRRDVMESFFKKMEQINNRIASVDNRMFDQIQALLTEEQLANIPRARMARQRVRVMSNQMMGVTGAPGATNLDLSEMVIEMDVPAEPMQLIDPVLSQYESRLTSAMVKLGERANGMMLKIFDAMEAMGFTEQSMADPETATKLGEAMQKMWRDVTLEVMDAAKDVTELNQRTYKSLEPLMPEDLKRPLRQRYYSRAYPEAGFALKDDEPFFKAALKISELTDDQRTTITQARDTLTSKMDKMAEEAVALIDAQRKDFSPFDFNSERMQEHYKKISELQANAAEAQRAATETVNTALGPELAQKIGRDIMANAPTTVSGAFIGGMGAGVAVASVEAESVVVEGGDAVSVSWSGDQFVCGPISAADLTEYATRLQLNEDQKVMLRQLHADYLEQHKIFQETQMAAVTKAAQAMWKFDDATQQMASPTAQSIEQVYQLRREAMAALKTLDQSFFDDVQATLLEQDAAPRLARVRLLRERACYNRGRDMMWGWFGGSNEPTIDLTDFIRQQRLNDADNAAIDSELEKYETAATPAFRDRFDAAMAMQKAQELWQVEAMQAQKESEGNAMRFATRYQEVMGEVSKRITESNTALTTLNRATLDRVLTALPVETSTRVRSAYNRRAFPNVYNDDLALETRLNDALKLSDLGPEQRKRITELANDYRPNYARFCEQMVEISSKAAAPNWTAGSDMEGWQKWQEQQETLASIKFDRRELSQRTITTLKSILSEEQIKQIGGLPEPKEKGPYDDWMN